MLYRILNKETREVNGVKVYRVEVSRMLPRDIRISKFLAYLGINPGDKGGWVESLNNVESFSWVYDDAVVMGKAKIKMGVKIKNNSIICGSTNIWGSSYIGGDVYIEGNNLLIEKQSTILDYCHISGTGFITGQSVLQGKTTLVNPEIDAQSLFDGEVVNLYRESDTLGRGEYPVVITNAGMRCGCVYMPKSDWELLEPEQSKDLDFYHPKVAKSYWELNKKRLINKF